MTLEQRKRISEGHKGKHHSEETRKKMSEVIKKAYSNLELRKKMSEAHKGQIPWMKGKHHSEESKKKMSLAHKGLMSGNKGKHWSEEMKKKMSETEKRLYSEGKIIHPMKGKHPTPETLKRLSESHKGQIPWITGKHHTEESKRKGGGTLRRLYSEGKIIHPMKGKHWSEEMKIKLSEAHKGQIAWNKGKPVSEETKRKLREFFGEKASGWKGGISFEPYSLDWRESLKKIIRQRDNYTCQLCGKNGVSVHHIDYNKKNCNPENLVTLCSHCHTKTNQNRKKWTELFQVEMKKKV